MAACAFLWSLAGLFIKLVPWHPFAIAGARSAVASVFLFAMVRRPHFHFSPAQVGSALAYTATMLLFVFANKNTTSANAILLQYSSPVYVAIFGALLLGEIPKWEHWAALAAVAGGIVLFFSDSLGGGNLLGDIMAALSGLAFALHTVFMRKQKDASPIESVLLAHISTAVIAGIVSLFQPPVAVTAKSLAVIGFLGIFQVGLAAVFFSYGIKRITALQSVLIAVIEPLLNPVWVFLATGEEPGARSLAGGAVIIVAVMASSVISIRRIQVKPEESTRARRAAAEGGKS